MDAHNGEPLDVAEVILSHSNRSTVTGSDGHYLFSNLQAGDYVLTI